MNTSKTKFNQSLLFKVFSVIVLTTVLTLIITGFLSLSFTVSALQNVMKQNELGKSKIIMDKIDRMLNEKYNDIQVIAGERSFERYLSALMKGEIPERHIEQDCKDRIRGLPNLTGSWNTLLVVDSKGTIVVSTLEGEEGKPLDRWHYKNIAYQKAMKGESSHSDFVVLKHTGESAMVFASPIRDENDPLKPVIGAVIGDMSWMNISQILDDLINENVFLINHAGNIIAGNAKNLKDVLLDESKGKAILNELGKNNSDLMVISGKQGIFYEDTLVAMASQQGYLSYQGNGWNLILSAPTRIAFTPARKAADKVVLLLMPVIMLTGGLSLIAARKIIIHPITSLTKAVKDISNGDLTKRVPVFSNDEIGQLGISFNEMTVKLKESYMTLEERVSVRTRELASAQAQLLQSEKLASIGQLAAGVAHEINNPVGFISNNMELLAQYVGEYAHILKRVGDLKNSVEEGNMEQAKAIIQDINKFEQEIQLDYVIKDTDNLLRHNQKGIERIRKIVMDLRTFAREDNNLMELVKIEDVIDSILSIVHNELKYKADLKKSYGETPLVKCNTQRLGQVFINLLLNASQAIEEKGVIEIKTYQEDQYLCIDVKDTGQGIPPENLRRIFDAFFTTKPVGQGTGLGLSVSYEIIKKHGGELKVRSQVGAGTVFTVMLPLS